MFTVININLSQEMGDTYMCPNGKPLKGVYAFCTKICDSVKNYACLWQPIQIDINCDIHMQIETVHICLLR